MAVLDFTVVPLVFCAPTLHFCKAQGARTFRARDISESTQTALSWFEDMFVQVHTDQSAIVQVIFSATQSRIKHSLVLDRGMRGHSPFKGKREECR
jgi:hypothetical protein